MLALPIGLLKESLLSSTETVDEGDLIGPAQTFEVEMLFEDEETGAQFPAGFGSEVLGFGLLERRPSATSVNTIPVTDSSEDIKGFHEAHFQCPAFYKCTSSAQVMSWAEQETIGRVHFYSAREEPAPKTQQAPKKAAANRLTNAALAEQIQSLAAQVACSPAEPVPSPRRGTRHRPRRMVDLVPLLCDGLATLAPSGPVPKMPAVSQGLQTAGLARSPAKALQLLGPPPRTRGIPTVTSGPALPQFDEPYDPLGAPPDPQDQILSQQTAALNALVSHLVQGGGDRPR